MKKVMFKIWILALLSMISKVALAQDVKVDLNDSYIGGSVEVTDIGEPAEDGSVVVTIMVKPATGYYIAKSDVLVVSTISVSATREGDLSIGGSLELEGDDPDDLTEKRDYRFTVLAGLGAWVKEADFHQVVRDPYDISGDDESNVTWSYADNVLTITGSGITADFDDEGFTDPWAAIRDQITSVTIGEGVTALGADIFKDCTALTTIYIENVESVLTLGEGAIPANDDLEVYVPGQMLTEYQTTEGWMDMKIGSEGCVTMSGFEFGTNHYDTFVSDESIVVPSVLTAYVITDIKGTGLVLSEVKTISAGMPVLVYNKNDLKDVTFYSAPAEATRGGANLLQVAGSDGQKVALGEVYILHNDVFYYCQAGTIPAGHVYLTNPAPEKTRSAYLLGNGDTTGMEMLRLNETDTDVWYSLDGRRLSTMPTRKGIYIKNGKKVVIK